MKDDRPFPTFAGIPSALLRAVKWLWRRTWRWIAGLLILAILAHTVASIVTGREMERELGKLRAAGEPLTLAEAAPKPVPASRNAAVLYQRAFERLPSDEQAWQPVYDVLWGRPGARARLSRADVERFVAQHREAIALLEQAARMPECRFPVHWEAGFAATFPHLAKVGGSASLLATAAIVDARGGRTTEAASAVEAALGTADHIGVEPTSVSQLVRYRCQATALLALNRMMEIHRPDAAESERMFNLLSRIDTIGPFIHGMKGERALGLWGFDFARRHPLPLSRLAGPYMFPGKGSTRAERLASFLWRPLFNKDEVIYLRLMARQIRVCRLPYREARRGMPMPRPETMETRPPRTQLPRYAVITQMLLPVFDLAIAARDKALAHIGLAQWGLAINVFQIREGRWPKSLEEVRRTVAWKLAGDPFSGKDFIYRLEPLAQPRGKPQGYLLYSIGPNLRDDGGRSGVKEAQPGEKEVPDDLVWRVHWPGGS